MKILISVVLALVGILTLGYVSGNQPERDPLEFVEQVLGIELEEKIVDVGEVRLHVMLAGPEDGQPVLLLHGFPEFWFAWRGVIAELADAGFRVIVPDQRGYNRSDKLAQASMYTLDKLAGDMSSLISQLGYQKVYLAGHDFGGQVAWWTLILHEDQVEKFVILNKPHPLALADSSEDSDDIGWYRYFLQLPVVPGYVARLGDWYILEKYLNETSDENTFTPEVMDFYKSAWNHEGAFNTMSLWYKANHNFQMDVDYTVVTPGLFVMAANDAFSSKDEGRLSLNYMPNGALRELDHGTHWIVQEDAVLVANILKEFFASSGMD